MSRIGFTNLFVGLMGHPNNRMKYAENLQIKERKNRVDGISLNRYTFEREGLQLDECA